MDKIKTIKIKNPNGSVSEETYIISVDANNVDMKNGKDLQVTIGNINVDKDGSIADQLGKYKDYDSDIEALYADVDSLEAADTDLEKNIIDLQVNKINKIDIIDNLNSSSNTKVLSAKQGKVLGDAVAALEAESIKKKAYYFDTVAGMKAANLKNGDYACTLGYYSANDGGAAEYKIRIKNSSDIINNGSIIGINETLVAELIIKDSINVKQFGAKGDNETDDTAAIQQVLNNYTIIYIPEGTYKLTSSLIVKENSYIKCNNKAIMMSNHDTPFVINGTSEDTDVTEYNGNSNITIDGGIWDNNIKNFTAQKSGFAFGHAKNITIKNLTILNTIKGHSIEIAGIDNMVIDNCKFLGCIPSSEVTYWESIQIEMCTSDGFSYFGVGDYTKPKNIKIKNCLFTKTEDSSYFHTAIGNHYSRHDQYFDNILIENNIIEGCDYAGVRCYLFENAKIINNTFTKCKRGIMLSGSSGNDSNSNTIENIQTNIPQSCKNILIENNTFTESTTIDIWSVNYKKDDIISLVDNIKIINNISNKSLGSFIYITYGNNINIQYNIVNGIEARAIDLSDCSNLIMDKNIIKQNKNSTQCMLLRSTDTNNILCTNINVLNNSISGSYTEGINFRGVNIFNVSNNVILDALSNPIYFNNFCTNGNINKNKIDSSSTINKEYVKIFGTLNNHVVLRDNIYNNYNEANIPFSITNTNKIYNDDTMSSWKPLSLSEGILALDANPPMIIKNNKIINIRGGLTNVTSNDQIVATLPDNMIPSTGRYFVIPTAHTELEFVRIEIDNTGNIKIKQTAEVKSDTIYRLDNIFFTLD